MLRLIAQQQRPEHLVGAARWAAHEHRHEIA
jgi:hypothetical protein